MVISLILIAIKGIRISGWCHMIFCIYNTAERFAEFYLYTVSLILSDSVISWFLADWIWFLWHFDINLISSDKSSHCHSYFLFQSVISTYRQNILKKVCREMWYDCLWDSNLKCIGYRHLYLQWRTSHSRLHKNLFSQSESSHFAVQMCRTNFSNQFDETYVHYKKHS